MHGWSKMDLFLERRISTWDCKRGKVACHNKSVECFVWGDTLLNITCCVKYAI